MKFLATIRTLIKLLTRQIKILIKLYKDGRIDMILRIETMYAGAGNHISHILLYLPI